MNIHDYRTVLFATVLLGASFAMPMRAQTLGIGDTLPILDRDVFDISREGRVDVNEVLGASGTLFIFWSNQCAWTNRYLDRLEALASLSDSRGVRIVLVNSNNQRVFPREGLEPSRAFERAHDEFVYLFDDGAAVARAFGAERTPQVFAFDAGLKLVYVGAIDDSPGDPRQVTVNYVKDVVDALMRGAMPAVQESKPFGCQIRY